MSIRARSALVFQRGASCSYIGVFPDVAKPPTVRITDVIMPLPYTTTDVALGCMFPAVMSMDSPTDGAVGACMLADSVGALKLLDPKLSPYGGFEITVIHPWCPFFRDEVGTRFGA